MRRFGSLLVLAAVLAAVPAAAQTGEEACIHDYVPGLAACQGTDVVPTAVELVSIVNDCGSDATAQVILDVVLSATATRFDIGMFVARNGDSALSGGLCYHDYLAPPITTSPTYGDHNANTISDIRNGPWQDLEQFAQPPDSCGDMLSNTEAIKSLQTAAVPLQVDCVDTNQDGTVDVSVCASWTSGTSNRCDSLPDAVPPGADRCSCARLEVLPEPGAAVALACGVALLAALAVRRAD